ELHVGRLPVGGPVHHHARQSSNREALMNNILVINSSAAGDDAASRVLVRNVVEALRREASRATVVERDVGREPIPHLTGEALGGIGRGDAQTPDARRTRALSDTLIAELRAADVI